MMLEILKKCRASFLVSIIVFNLSLSVVYAGWQETLESKFDIVETFDQLQDWHGTGANGAFEIEKYPNDFPKKLDGSPSIWGWYSYYQQQPVAGEWIGNHGDGNSWQGTKSLRMNLSHRNQNGPSRFGTYFGNGNREFGYSSVYVFYMVKISKNQWPTKINDGVGEYIEGGTYVYLDSWKFNTMNMGCKVAYCNQDVGTETQRSTYSDFHSITHLNPSGQSGTPQYTPSIVAGFTDHVSETRFSKRQDSPYIEVDDWVGVEFHWYFREDSGNQYGIMDSWWYDRDGNAHLVIQGHELKNQSQPSDQSWNSFFFGGNNSNGYSWGDSMQPEYFIDDFIINGAPIGPSYFALLRAEPPEPGIKPKNVHGSTFSK